MQQKNRARLFAVLAAFVALTVSLPVFAANLTDMRQWLVSRMAAWSPPGRSLIAGAKETPEEGLTRYGEIADAIIAVAYDPSEKVPFRGKRGRARTAAILTTVALFESGFRKDVDLNIGAQARGDGGKSWCMMQVQLGQPANGKTSLRIALKGDGYEFTKDSAKGWGGEDLISDRKACFRIGLRMINKSFNSCNTLPVLEKLSAYTSGNCADGRKSSRSRVGKAVTWLNDLPPPLDDAAVQALLSPPIQKAPEPPLEGPGGPTLVTVVSDMLR